MFGIVVLGSNLVNEYYAYGGDISPADLPSLASALRRAGARETEVRENLNWRVFAGQQIYRAGGAALARRHWATWAAPALFGFFWAVPMRVNAACPCRDFEAVFYVGVPLALFGLALMGARRIWGERATVAAALAAVVIFAVSAFQIQTGELAGDAENPETLKAEMADLDAVRQIARGKDVAVLPDVFDPLDNIMDYYLAGSVLVKGEPTFAQMARADFVVSRSRDYGGAGFNHLTPENREIFLHAAPRDILDFYRSERRRVESDKPAARSDFDLYLDGDTLYYVKDPCAEYDARGRFLLSVHPVDVSNLPQDRRARGHDSLNFDFAQRGTPVFDSACIAKAPLPDYEIAVIETGQWIPGGEGVWRVAINPPLSAKSVAYYESVYAEIAASGAPPIRSKFDVYKEGDALTYLKSPCAESDTRARFFLSVRPVNLAVLSQDRRAMGHDALNFDFSPHGIIFNGKCMIRREMPGYEIARISTGQYIPDAGETWRADAKLLSREETAAHYETVYEVAKASGEPIIRSDFDVYMDAHALTYLKEPCAESDTHGRFFLGVRPVKPEDLAENRPARGRDSLDFDFSQSGIIFNGKCMARRELPGYAIAEIATGRRVPDEGEIWSAAARLPIGAESAVNYEAAYQAAKATGEPIIRSDFDVYKEGDTLTYLKAPCAEDDTRGRFFLSVHPVDVDDLPENRRELGHDGLNFDFAPDGIIFNGKCMVWRALPGYAISRIETGQWIPGVATLWAGAADMGD